MRSAFIGLGLIALLYVISTAAAWWWQERIVWQPPGAAPGAVFGARRVAYEAEDGQPLHGYLVGDPGRAKALLIAFHGNAELAAWSGAWAAEVERRTGWAVLVPEYRGYGGLPGIPDYAGSQRDARAAYRVAVERLGADSSRVALYGHSLGSALAAELAAEHRPAALILSAPFTSARDMAAAMRGLPIAALWGIIGRVHFDTRRRVTALDAPVFVVHGDRDAVIAVEMGRAVFAAARRPGELFVVPGAGHNDLQHVAGLHYWAWLERAMATAGRSRLSHTR